MSQADLPIRVMTPEDAPRAAALSQKIGWSHSESGWERLIRWGGAGCLCITDGDKIVATTIALTYSEELAWIGMVITHSDYQRRGLARRLMQKVLSDLGDCRVQRVMLDASQSGYPLYIDLGFRPLYKVEVFGGQAIESGHDEAVREVTPADIDLIINLDEQLFGVPRMRIIHELAVPGQCWVSGEPGNIQGYAMANRTRLGISIGPWYHRTPTGAEALLRRALTVVHNQDARVYIPELNIEAKTIAERCGLTNVRYTTRMILGGDPLGEMTRQYGIASFATG